MIIGPNEENIDLFYLFSFPSGHMSFIHQAYYHYAFFFFPWSSFDVPVTSEWQQELLENQQC